MYTIVARWYVKPDRRADALKALKALADQVKGEQGTLTYLIHTAADGSLPPAPANEILFFEVYRDKAAFEEHLKDGGPFERFVRAHGDLFVHVPNGGPFFLASNVDRFAGFGEKD